MVEPSVPSIITKKSSGIGCKEYLNLEETRQEARGQSFLKDKLRV